MPRTRNLLLAIATGLVFTAHTRAHAQTMDCTQFRTGKYRTVDNGILSDWLVVRHAHRQRETNGDKRLKLKVEWLDDCTYRITRLAVKPEAYRRKVEKIKPSPYTIFRIIRVEGQSYTCEIYPDGFDGKLGDVTLVKVN